MLLLLLLSAVVVVEGGGILDLWPVPPHHTLLVRSPAHLQGSGLVVRKLVVLCVVAVVGGGGVAGGYFRFVACPSTPHSPGKKPCPSARLWACGEETGGLVCCCCCRGWW